MELYDLFYRFGIALAIGILIGMQREYAGNASADLVAGARTFALISLTGCTAALAADQLDSPLVFLGIVAMIVGQVIAAYVVTGKESPGITTEVATTLTVLIGALCYWDYIVLAAALAVVTTGLLTLKVELHTFAHKLTAEDFRASLLFAVITIIILPVLPNRPLGETPFDVLNLYKIWLMVVFVSGISFMGYILNKLIGVSRGIALAGLLGGMVSSTAATMTFARRSRQAPELSRSFGLAIMIAWLVMNARIALIVVVINKNLLGDLWKPLVVMSAILLVYSFVLYRFQAHAGDEHMNYTNPFELRPALQFGILYAGILFFSRLTQIHLHEAGVYISSLIAGLADLNAITLSLGELSSRGAVAKQVAAQAIILGAVANTLMKGILVAANGTSELRKIVQWGTLLVMISGVGMVFMM